MFWNQKHNSHVSTDDKNVKELKKDYPDKTFFHQF